MKKQSEYSKKSIMKRYTRLLSLGFPEQDAKIMARSQYNRIKHPLTWQKVANNV